MYPCVANTQIKIQNISITLESSLCFFPVRYPQRGNRDWSISLHRCASACLTQTMHLFRGTKLLRLIAHPWWFQPFWYESAFFPQLYKKINFGLAFFCPCWFHGHESPHIRLHFNHTWNSLTGWEDETPPTVGVDEDQH